LVAVFKLRNAEPSGFELSPNAFVLYPLLFRKNRMAACYRYFFAHVFIRFTFWRRNCSCILGLRKPIRLPYAADK
jgi:hypothetical protein